jgi:predicted dehydrogenase
MNTLIIGYGSIGERHARILNDLGHRVSIVSRHARKTAIDSPFEWHCNIETASVNKFEYIVVANRSNEHFDTLCELSQRGFDGTLLIEKPLFEKSYPIPANLKATTFVAYNLRFHPLLERLRSLLAGQRLIAVQARVGQYLPDWRPGSDYRSHYSAKRREGGGVLTDLSHELDYLTWLLGDWQNLTARGGKFSDLEIDSDDVFTLLWETERCPVVSLTMNYLDTTLLREFI